MPLTVGLAVSKSDFDRTEEVQRLLSQSEMSYGTTKAPDAPNTARPRQGTAPPDSWGGSWFPGAAVVSSRPGLIAG